MRIAVDVMGSDESPQLLCNAIADAAVRFGPSHALVLLATQEVIDAFKPMWEAQYNPRSCAKIEYLAAATFITMDDDPVGAARHKKDSSMLMGIKLLKKHQVDALVSVGNTGALVASSTLSLPALPGISRPALLAVLPTENGFVAVIDVGGNVYGKARNLVQFAQMGAAYQRCIQNIDLPRVGLLNIGQESRKGTLELRQAYQILKDESQSLVAQGLSPGMTFLGNVEGRDIFLGEVDVLVTDGFTGNILLKTVEGAASFIFGYLIKNCPSQSQDKLQHTLNQLHRHFNYAEYPGAIVCGVEGVVVKCHGHSSSKALLNGIQGAFNLVQKKLIHRIKEQLG